MAAEGGISHNPDLTTQVSGWSDLAENVGVGWDVLGLMDAFIASPHHYANLVNPTYTHVGVGVAFGSDGAMYTTHDFMTPEAAPLRPPRPPPSRSPTGPAARPGPAHRPAAHPPPPAPITPVAPAPQPRRRCSRTPADRDTRRRGARTPPLPRRLSR